MLERFIELGSLPLLVAALVLAGFGVPIPEDVVLIAGKGHEDYQIIGAERRHFSDSETVREWAGQNRGEVAA